MENQTTHANPAPCETAPQAQHMKAVWYLGRQAEQVLLVAAHAMHQHQQPGMGRGGGGGALQKVSGKSSISSHLRRLNGWAPAPARRVGAGARGGGQCTGCSEKASMASMLYITSRLR